MDLRLTILEETRDKPLRSRWVPSHRDRAKAKTKEERTKIRHNDKVDRWLKWQLAYLSLNKHLPTQVTLLSMGVLRLPQPKNGS